MHKKAFFLFCILLVSFFLPTASATPCRSAFLSWQIEDSEIFILKIYITPNTPLCGLELDLYYNNDILFLNSCERGSSLISLDFACSPHPDEGRLRLLFWGGENALSDGCEIASISFSQKPDCFGDCEFSLILPTENSSLYFDENKIFSQNLALEGICVYLQDHSECYPVPTEDAPTECVSEAVTECESDSGNSAEDTTEFVLHRTPDGKQRREETFCVLKIMSVCLSCICILASAGALFFYFKYSDLLRKGYF